MSLLEWLLFFINLILSIFSQSPTPTPTTSPPSPSTTNAPVVVSIPSMTPPTVSNPVKAPVPVVAPIPKAPVPAPATSSSFELGLLQAQQSDKLRLSKGLTAKIIARTGQSVPYTSPNATRSSSILKFHSIPDGADIFTLPNGGYVYTSNSEVDSKGGGVYGIEFDSEGRVREYKVLLSGTSRNCNGGRTPWNTWVSCEEVPGGQCWQVDPTGVRTPEITVMGGTTGGAFEAFTYDARSINATSYYVTEDTSNGALRRYRPPSNIVKLDWDVLHNTDGTLDYLEFLQNNQFRWTSSLSVGRTSAQTYYPNSEGIDIFNNKLHFVSKVKKQLFTLDLDALTYTVISTRTSTLPGGGSFDDQPDHLLATSTSGNILLTEDGGTTPGLFVYDGTKYLSYFESDYTDDEVVGIAFSPNHKYLYAVLQDAGFVFQISRDDGQAFDARRAIRV